MYIVHAPDNKEKLENLIENLSMLRNELATVLPDSFDVAMLRNVGRIVNPAHEFMTKVKNGEFDNVPENEYQTMLEQVKKDSEVFMGQADIGVHPNRLERMVNAAVTLTGDLEHVLYVLNVMNGTCMMASDLGPTCEECKCREDCPGCENGVEFEEVDDSGGEVE